MVIFWITCCFGKFIMGLEINPVVYFRNLISNFIMTLQSLALPAYKIPAAVKKQSWAKKRKEELERVLKAVVGRELRMIELKKKIKELEEKLKK